MWAMTHVARTYAKHNVARQSSPSSTPSTSTRLCSEAGAEAFTVDRSPLPFSRHSLDRQPLGRLENRSKNQSKVKSWDFIVDYGPVQSCRITRFHKLVCFALTPESQDMGSKIILDGSVSSRAS